MIFETVAQ